LFSSAFITWDAVFIFAQPIAVENGIIPTDVQNRTIKRGGECEVGARPLQWLLRRRVGHEPLKLLHGYISIAHEKCTRQGHEVRCVHPIMAPKSQTGAGAEQWAIAVWKRRHPRKTRDGKSITLVVEVSHYKCPSLHLDHRHTRMIHEPAF